MSSSNVTNDKKSKKRENVSYSDRMDILALAQLKFDEIRRENRNGKSKSIQSSCFTSPYSLRPSSSLSTTTTNTATTTATTKATTAIATRGTTPTKKGNDESSNPEKTKSNVFSTLLYLSLMMYKVDDMKVLLQREDLESYQEWKLILDGMHSPIFHLHERRVQNHRSNVIYQRKEYYKSLWRNMSQKVKEMHKKNTWIQNHANDNIKNLSDALNKAIEDNQQTKEWLFQKHNVEKDLVKARDEIQHLQIQNDKYQNDIQQCREHTIPNLEKELNEIQNKRNALCKELEWSQKETQEKEMENTNLKNEIKDQCNKKDEIQSKYVQALNNHEMNIQKQSEIHTKDQMRIMELETELKLMKEKYNQYETQMTNTLSECQCNYNKQLKEVNEELRTKQDNLLSITKELESTQENLKLTRQNWDKQKMEYKQLNESISNERIMETKTKNQWMEMMTSKDLELSKLHSTLEQCKETTNQIQMEKEQLINKVEQNNQALQMTIQTLETQLTKYQKQEKEELYQFCQSLNTDWIDMKQSMKTMINDIDEKYKQSHDETLLTIHTTSNDIQTNIQHVETHVHDEIHQLVNQSQLHAMEEIKERNKIQESIVKNQSTTEHMTNTIHDFLTQVKKLKETVMKLHSCFDDTFVSFDKRLNQVNDSLIDNNQLTSQWIQIQDLNKMEIQKANNSIQSFVETKVNDEKSIVETKVNHDNVSNQSFDDKTNVTQSDHSMEELNEKSQIIDRNQICLNVSQIYFQSIWEQVITKITIF